MAIVEVKSRLLESPVASRQRLVTQLASRAAGGRGRLVVLRGMPGTGVSMLLRTLRDGELSQGTHTVHVVFDEVDRDLPYAGLGHLYKKAVGAGWPHGGLDPETQAARAAKDFVEALTSAVGEREPGRRNLLIIDNLEFCDDHTALVLRHVVPTFLALGDVVVLGDNLARPTEIGSHFAEFALYSDEADLVTVPHLTQQEIIALVRDRAGIGCSTVEATRIEELTEGRFAAVSAFLAGFEEDDYADFAITRSMPFNTGARMRPYHVFHHAETSEATRIAAQVCAVARHSITDGLLRRVLDMLHVAPVVTDVADGLLVERNSLTGRLHLGDPLAATSIRAEMDPVRLRAISALLAERTHGLESFQHRLRSLESVTAEDADDVLAAVASFEAEGHHQDVVALLETACQQAQGGDQYPRLLRALGAACVRYRRVRDHQHLAGHFAELAQQEWWAGYVHAHFRTVRGLGALEATQARLAFLRSTPVDVDHRFCQADVALLEFLARFECGDAETAAALEEARDRLADLVGERPTSPGLAWMDAEARLELLHALAVYVTAQTTLPPTVVEMALDLVRRARALPPHSADRGEVLVLAAMLLADMDEVEHASDVLRELDELRPGLDRPLLLEGQLRVVRADISVRSGDWGLARAIVTDALLVLDDHPDASSRTVLPALRSWLEAVSGDVSEGRRFLGIARAAACADNPGHGLVWLPLAEAETARHEAGDPAEALRRVDDAPVRLSRIDLPWLVGMKLELLTQAGYVEAAGEALKELESLVDSSGLRVPNRLEYYRGLVAVGEGDPERGVAHFRRALAGGDHPFFAGRCHLALGCVHQGTRGMQESAYEHFKAAREVFEDLGAQTYVAHVDEMLAVLERDLEERLALLSARERQIAELASRGWTNKEIARELSISASTAAFHLSNVMEKVGVTRRTEIAPLLRPGLVRRVGG